MYSRKLAKNDNQNILYILVCSLEAVAVSQLHAVQQLREAPGEAVGCGQPGHTKSLVPTAVQCVLPTWLCGCWESLSSPLEIGSSRSVESTGVCGCVCVK